MKAEGSPSSSTEAPEVWSESVKGGELASIKNLWSDGWLVKIDAMQHHATVWCRLLQTSVKCVCKYMGSNMLKLLIPSIINKTYEDAAILCRSLLVVACNYYLRPEA